MLKTTMLAALMMAPLVAQAQSASQIAYRCTGTDGKRYYGSTIPMKCVDSVVEQPNAQGIVVRGIDRDGEEKEREAKAAAAAKAQVEEATTREDSPSSRALLAT